MISQVITSVRCRRAFAAVLTIAALSVSAQEARIGYVYPAGGQRSSTTRVVVGGQYLQRPTAVFVSGSGVKATVVRHVRLPRNVNREQRVLILREALAAVNKRMAEAGVDSRQAKEVRERLLQQRFWSLLKAKDVETDGVKLPQHPLLDDIGGKSMRELSHMIHHVFFPREKRQLNRQLDELVVIDVRIGPQASPGDRTLRVRTARGLSNPIVFQVGDIRETQELEPNDTSADEFPNVFRPVKASFDVKPLNVPVVLNGQVMPGDVDRFRLKGRKGQRWLLQVSARRLVPYLADAVPGWFQSTLAVYGPDGRELAFADDHKFDPDPVMVFDVPENGDYEVEIRDAIYRGREDFVYRISVQPAPTRLTLDELPAGPTYPFPPAYSDLPKRVGREPDDDPRRTQPVGMPCVVVGMIDSADDKDCYHVNAVAGDTIVAEVFARREGSPLDSVVKILDSSGQVLALNDDYVVKDKHVHLSPYGLTTHHADSYARCTVPRAGQYTIQLSDVQRHGGKDYRYRMRISKATPDFTLMATPSGIYCRPGEMVPIELFVLRKEGFDGPIQVEVKDPSSGFSLRGDSVIPAGSNRLRLTLCAPRKAPDKPVEIKLAGSARMGDKSVTREAIPADNVMQAFLYRHLVPQESMLGVIENQKWAMPNFLYAGEGSLELRAGETTQIRIRTPKRNDMDRWELELDNPPEGVTLVGGISRWEQGIAFDVAASCEMATKTLQENLIVRVLSVNETKPKDGRPARKSRWPVGYLPAIPVQLTP